MSVVRALPARPNLEFERKQAKALLRQLRTGHPDAIARVRAQHPPFDATNPKLADAQLALAREYGFTSWARLVRYFEDFERQWLRPRTIQSSRHGDASVRSFIRQHSQRAIWIGRALAAYVPRFYGRPLDEVFEMVPTEDEARLANARLAGAPNAEEHARAAARFAPRPAPWEETPERQASSAIRAADLAALERIVREHPSLLDPLRTNEMNLMHGALVHARREGMDKMRPVVDWLATKGFDRQSHLNQMLCGWRLASVDEVRQLLAEGADPKWIAPNGYSVLEHALLNYWNGEAVDLIALRATPRDALWVCAGLGDVRGVARHLDQHGRPRAHARRTRPYWDAMSHITMPQHPEPTDEELLLEAFFIAMLNQRYDVMEYMARRGTLVNSLLYGQPLIGVAIGNRWVGAVESLIRCGADLELRGWHPRSNAREEAASHLESSPDDPSCRRIAELCGLDPAAVLATRDARPLPETHHHPSVGAALARAREDAARHGSGAVTPENLLFGLLRHEGVARGTVHRLMRDHAAAFRELRGPRLKPAPHDAQASELPLDAAVAGILAAAEARQKARRHSMIGDWHVLLALVRLHEDLVTRFLEPFGVTAVGLEQALDELG